MRSFIFAATMAAVHTASILTTKTSITTATCCDPLLQTLPLCREGCACCPDGGWVGSIGDANTFYCGEVMLQKDLKEDQDKFGEICNVTTDAPLTTKSVTTQTAVTSTAHATTETCCDPSLRTVSICREGCACCPDGNWVGSIGDATTFYCDGIELIKGKDVFGDICDVTTDSPVTTLTTDSITTRTEATLTLPVTTGTCCDPSLGNFAANDDCREGCACCPDGNWVGSIGDAATFYCDGVELVKGKDVFGDICDATTDAPVSTTETSDTTGLESTTVLESTSLESTGLESTTGLEICCDPSLGSFSANSVCKEGCACCADGTWVGSIGDANTFYCGDLMLQKDREEDQDKFGEICDTTTESPDATDAYQNNLASAYNVVMGTVIAVVMFSWME